MPTLTWANRNRIVQADVPVDHFAANTGLEDGQETKIEWRWRADPGDAWSAATVHTVTVPPTSTFNPPADGWVQAKVYSWRDSLESWEHYLLEWQVVGGAVVSPETRITTTADRRVTTSGDVRKTTG
ncbi:hypothetical protein [Thermomonas sp.]|uniref:hypothetical protein n=1 Tax=Thermomonas sp. TaxID=1971895 RepID=UPI0035B1CD23